MDLGTSRFDEVNRPRWSAVPGELLAQGWADPGELAALLLVADEIRGKRLIDVGVGAGRTVPLLRLASADYVALDYTPEMVALCRDRHPDVDVRVGDARDLAEIDDASKDFYLFSMNGLDAVDHDDRQRVLAEAARVLCPGGLLVFSTLNKDGPFYGCHPGNAPDTAWTVGSLLPRQGGGQGGGHDGATDDSWAEAIGNWRRLRSASAEGPGWAVAPFAAHLFSLLGHFVTLDAEREELEGHGFRTETVIPCDRSLPLADGEQSGALYLNFVARKR